MSTPVRSSFPSRKKNSAYYSSSDDTNAMLNIPVSDQEDQVGEDDNLLTSEPGSNLTCSSDDIQELDPLKTSNRTNDDYKSDSCEPKTPEVNSINLRGSDNYGSDENNPSKGGMENKSTTDAFSNPFEDLDFNELVDVPDIPDNSVFLLNSHERFEPTLEHTTLLGSQSQISQPFELSYTQRSLEDNPLLFLASQEQNIDAQLQRNINSHYEVSKNGLSSKKIRKNILNCMNSHSNIYDAIIEFQTKELNRKSLILKAFKGWQYNKSLLNKKVEEIRSGEAGEGLRLNHLLDEFKSVNTEIDQLEKRLAQLKDKKNVLKTEIAQSQSIIESRASSYIESLRDIQKAEDDTVIKLSRERTLDSTISDPFNRNGTSNQSVWNYLARFTPSLNNGDSYQIESSQVIEMLIRQSESYQDQIDSYSKKKLNAEQSSIMWQDISIELNMLEDAISSTIQSTQNTNSSPNDVKLKILELLVGSLDRLTDRKNSLKIVDPLLSSLIKNEISILEQGIYMIDPETVNIGTLSISGLDEQGESSKIANLNVSPSSSLNMKPVPRLNVPEKSSGSSNVDTVSAIRSGIFSSASGSFKSQLKGGFLNQNSSKLNEKRTKND